MINTRQSSRGRRVRLRACEFEIISSSTSARKMMAGLIDPSRQLTSHRLWWTRERVARTAPRMNRANGQADDDDDLVLAHTWYIKCECLDSERTSRNSEITVVAAFQPDLPLSTFAKGEREHWTSKVINHRNNIPRTRFDENNHSLSSNIAL